MDKTIKKINLMEELDDLGKYQGKWQNQFIKTLLNSNK